MGVSLELFPCSSSSTSPSSTPFSQYSDSPFFIDFEKSPHYERAIQHRARLPRQRTVLSGRRRFGTRGRIAIIFTTTLSFMILFRRHLFALALILNCYITWPIMPPPSLAVDIGTLPEVTISTQTPFIPRNMHHVLLGPLGHNPPADWIEARNSCVAMHSSWPQHYFWRDENADSFFEEHYPWFLDTWNSYPSIVQRADALRYFVLHKFGGVFLDMDLFCRNPLDPLISHLESTTPHQHKRPAQGGMYILAESGHLHMLLA